MTLPHLLVAVGLVLGTESDPETLVARLGSPRFVEREEAAKALLALGTDALKVLRAARSDQDPEIQNRAEGLIRSIELDLLTRPTLVRLRLNNRRLSEVLEDLGRQTHLDLALAGTLDPRFGPDALSAGEREPIPFWEVFDQLGLDLETTQDPISRRFGQSPLSQYRVTPRHYRATSIDGPFRFMIREVGLAGQAPDLNPQQIRFGRGNDARMEHVLQVVLTPEPRLKIRPQGNLVILEAIDGQGRPMLEPEDDRTEQSVGFGTDQALTTLHFPIRLPRDRDHPARSIQRLRGQLTVEIEARKTDPIVIPLGTPEKPEEQAVWCGDATLIPHGVTHNLLRGTWSVDLSLQPEGWTDALRLRGFARRRRFDPIDNDLQKVFESLVFADAEGHALPLGFARSARFAPDGIMLTIDVLSQDGMGPPSEIRYFGSLRAEKPLNFDFRDIALD